MKQSGCDFWPSKEGRRSKPKDDSFFLKWPLQYGYLIRFVSSFLYDEPVKINRAPSGLCLARPLPALPLPFTLGCLTGCLNTAILVCMTCVRPFIMVLRQLLQVRIAKLIYLLETTTYSGGGGGRGGYSAFFLALSPCDFFGRLWLCSLVDLCPADRMSDKVSGNEAGKAFHHGAWAENCPNLRTRRHLIDLLGCVAATITNLCDVAGLAAITEVPKAILMIFVVLITTSISKQ